VNMNKDNEQQIIKYLTGRMTPEENAEFSKLLSRDSELQEDFNELQFIKDGAIINHEIYEGHIDSETLTEYIASPELLTFEKKLVIENHLKSCTECESIVNLCIDPVPALAESSASERKSISSFLRDLFFAPRLSLGFGMGIALLLLIVLPAINWQSPTTTETYYTSIEIFPITKSAESVNDIKIVEDQIVVNFNFELAVPSSSKELFIIDLTNSRHELILKLANISYQKVFAIEIPVTYFTEEGTYILQVNIEEDDGVRVIDSFTLNIDLP